jgi:protein-L-isoaspartate O-methyltransferase
MQNTESSLRQYYAARAREYEHIFAKPERQADLARLKELLPPMFANRRVLEVACGTGFRTETMTAIPINVANSTMVQSMSY